MLWKMLHFLSNLPLKVHECIQIVDPDHRLSRSGQTERCWWPSTPPTNTNHKYLKIKISTYSNIRFIVNCIRPINFFIQIASKTMPKYHDERAQPVIDYPVDHLYSLTLHTRMNNTLCRWVLYYSPVPFRTPPSTVHIDQEIGCEKKWFCRIACLKKFPNVSASWYVSGNGYIKIGSAVTQCKLIFFHTRQKKEKNKEERTCHK